MDHVTFTVTHLADATAFFDAALMPLGLVRLVDYEDPEDEDEAGVEAVGYGLDTAQLWLIPGRVPTTGAHVAFTGADRAAIDASYAAGLAAGGRSRHAPRPWQIYRPGRYAAMLLDLHGNIVETFVDEG